MGTRLSSFTQQGMGNRLSSFTQQGMGTRLSSFTQQGMGTRLSSFTQQGIGTWLSSELGKVKAVRKRSGTHLSYIVAGKSLKATPPRVLMATGQPNLCLYTSSPPRLLERLNMLLEFDWLRSRWSVN